MEPQIPFDSVGVNKIFRLVSLTVEDMVLRIGQISDTATYTIALSILNKIRPQVKN